MKRMQKNKLIVLIMVILTLNIFSSCEKDEVEKQKNVADKMLRQHHENKLPPLIKKYYKTIMSIPVEELYEIDSEGNIVISNKVNTQVSPYIEKIKEFHLKYHSKEAIPRDSSTWEEWMIMNKLNGSIKKTVREKIDWYIWARKKWVNEEHVTFCPYCLGIEEEGADKEDELLNNYQLTYLLEIANIRENLYKSLCSLTNEEEFRKEVYDVIIPIIHDKSMFSEEETENTTHNIKEKYGTYYMNLTPEFANEIKHLYMLHNKYGHEKIASSDWKSVYMFVKRNSEYFGYNLEKGLIPACPVCILIDDQLLHKSNVTQDYLIISETYPYSYYALPQFEKYAINCEEFKEELYNSKSIEEALDDLIKEENKGGPLWQGKLHTYYGAVSKITFVEKNKVDFYYSMVGKPVYEIIVKTDTKINNYQELKMIIEAEDISEEEIEQLKESNKFYFRSMGFYYSYDYGRQHYLLGPREIKIIKIE